MTEQRETISSGQSLEAIALKRFSLQQIEAAFAQALEHLTGESFAVNISTLSVEHDPIDAAFGNPRVTIKMSAQANL